MAILIIRRPNGDFEFVQGTTEGAVQTAGGFSVRTATIAQNASLSEAIDVEGFSHVGVIMPSAWTAANLTFQTAATLEGPYVNVYTPSGDELTATVAAARAVAFDLAALKPWRFLKIRSGTASSPVAQQAERTLTLILKG